MQVDVVHDWEQLVFGTLEKQAGTSALRSGRCLECTISCRFLQVTYCDPAYVFGEEGKWEDGEAM